VVISRRNAEANRAKAAELELTFPIVLQRNWEVSLKYAMFATPVGYLINEKGVLLRDCGGKHGFGARRGITHA
jgi:hypothetical protein